MEVWEKWGLSSFVLFSAQLFVAGSELFKLDQKRASSLWKAKYSTFAQQQFI
jgi:hypothetical protein